MLSGLFPCIVILVFFCIYPGDDSDDSLELHALIKCLKKREEYELVVVGNYPGV
jgi:hypothetical protein